MFEEKLLLRLPMIRLHRCKRSRGTDLGSRTRCLLREACLLVVIVYLLSLALPKMPSPVVALFWVAFTLVSAQVLYQMVIRKVHKQL